jgi:hypothetical protein
MLTRTLLCSLVLAACGSDPKTPDATTVPATITVSGITQDIGLSGRTALAGVTVGVYKEGDTTPRAMAVSDSMGKFTLSVPTMGQPLDGYLLAQISSPAHVDSYLYPAAPLTADIANLAILIITQGTYDLASNLAQGGQTPGHAFVGVEAVDGAMTPIAGVTFTSTPAGTDRYNGSNGLPDKNATMTFTDGIGYVFQVAPGSVAIDAMKAGLTFHSHSVNARADKVTLTLIQTQ